MSKFVELLESRSFFSASTLLPPGAVEGKYKGTATIDGVQEEVMLTLTDKSARLTVAGMGSRSVTLTAHDFEEIRKGSFSESTTIKGTPSSGQAIFSSNGSKITGSGSYGTGSGAISGTFILRKYASA